MTVNKTVALILSGYLEREVQAKLMEDEIRDVKLDEVKKGGNPMPVATRQESWHGYGCPAHAIHGSSPMIYEHEASQPRYPLKCKLVSHRCPMSMNIHYLRVRRRRDQLFCSSSYSFFCTCSFQPQVCNTKSVSIPLLP